MQTVKWKSHLTFSAYIHIHCTVNKIINLTIRSFWGDIIKPDFGWNASPNEYIEITFIVFPSWISVPEYQFKKCHMTNEKKKRL